MLCFDRCYCLRLWLRVDGTDLVQHHLCWSWMLNQIDDFLFVEIHCCCFPIRLVELCVSGGADFFECASDSRRFEFVQELFDCDSWNCRLWDSRRFRISIKCIWKREFESDWKLAIDLRLAFHFGIFPSSDLVSKSHWCAIGSAMMSVLLWSIYTKFDFYVFIGTGTFIFAIAQMKFASLIRLWFWIKFICERSEHSLEWSDNEY